MQPINLCRHLVYILYAILFGLFFRVELMAQYVNNRKCPTSYHRNNGNGQYVTPFASNISATSVYAQQALTANHEGIFKFTWTDGITYPPIITRTLITPIGGVTAQDWVWGNNTVGSPFNPPGIPENGVVSYNFFNNNLPNAGLVTFEFSDPFNNQLINTCTYELKNGGSSSGNCYNFPVKSPSNFNYPISYCITSEDSSGETSAPNIDAGGGFITYSLQTPVDKISIDPSTGIISWQKNLPIDTFHLIVVASNGLLPNATTEVVLVVLNKGVCSGNDGGLESKSIGFALSNRLYDQIRSEAHTGMDYMKAVPFITKPVQEIIYGSGPSGSSGGTTASKFRNISLRDYMPDALIIGKDAKTFISSPTDIIQFTNAIDVMSVDYVQHGLNKAVAFSTKSNNSVYTHTKPVCDRLKGAELINVETINIRNLSLLKFTVRPVSGVLEYATSFSVGINPQNGQLAVQSQWFTDQYFGQDLMINFQLWSYDPNLLSEMINNVLSKFEQNFKLSQLGSTKRPLTYVQTLAKDLNDQNIVKLKIHDLSNSSSATLIIKSRQTEFDSIGKQTQLTIPLIPMGTSEVKLPLNDVAESEIRLMINGVQEDFIYYNDGLWNIHHPGTASVNMFTTSTDTIKPRIDEFRLFRNVKLNAITSEYITVYKMLRGGGIPMNLSDFNAIKFEATGNSPVRVRMLKKSVLNYEDQYEYVLNFSPSSKTYQINLNQFRSATFKKTIDPDDLLILSFTFEAQRPSSRIESTISNVRFVKASSTGSTIPQTMVISPNPVRSQFMMSFQSSFNESMTLQIIDIGSGRLLHERSLNVLKGQNNIQVQQFDMIASSQCIVRLYSPNQIFQAKMIKTD